MAHASISQIPTQANATAAWEEYYGFAKRYADDDALKCDMQFCMDMARAYDRWTQIFLKSGGAK